MKQPSTQPALPRRSTHPAAHGMRSVLVGIVVNLLLAITKATAGIIGHSYALVADGIESATDVFSSLIVYFGLRISTMPPDHNHPYGHGKAEPLAATIVAVSLMAASLVIAFKSIHEIITPHHAPAPYTLVVLAVVVLVKELMFRYVVRVSDEVGSTAVRTDAWHHRSDAITSALAFVGIAIALWGGPGYEPADDWAALGAAAVILYNAWQLLMPALGELTDMAPDAAVAERVHRIARQVPGVIDTEKCFVRKMGFDFFVDLHVVVDGNLTVRQGHLIAHAVEDAILAGDQRITEVLVHVEPDVYE